MTIQLGRITPVNQREGYSDTINPSGFVNAYSGTIQAGQQLQNLGARASDFFAKQKAIENDNYVNNQLLDFEKEKVKQLNYLTTDPKAKEKLSPSQYSQYITEKLTTFRSKQLTTIPATRLERFKINTERSIMEAQASALTHMKKINDDDFKLGVLRERKHILERAANSRPGGAFDIQTAVNWHSSRINNGVLGNVYGEAEGEKLKQSFEDELALTKLSRDGLELVKGGGEVNETQIDEHLANIQKSPLDPKDKPPMQESFLNDLAMQARRRESVANAQSKKIEDETFADFYSRMPDPDLVEQRVDVLRYEDVILAKQAGTIRNSTKIEDLLKQLSKQQKLEYFDEGYDIPAEMENTFQRIKSVVLKQDVFIEDAEALLDAFEGQVGDMIPLVSPYALKGEEVNAMFEKISSFRTAIRDRKTRFEEKNIQNARDDIEFLIAGDPLDRKFERKELNVIKDAQNTVEMMVKSGMNPKIAVETVNSSYIIRTGKEEFATNYDAKKAEAKVIEAYKKSTREMPDEYRELLRMIIKRRAAQPKENPGKTNEQLLLEIEKKANR